MSLKVDGCVRSCKLTPSSFAFQSMPPSCSQKTAGEEPRKNRSSAMKKGEGRASRKGHLHVRIAVLRSCHLSELHSANC